MRAQAGDEIVAHGNKVGQADRVGRIVEVRGPDGSPPYVVEWTGSPGTHLYFPGGDAQVHPHTTN